MSFQSLLSTLLLLATVTTLLKGAKRIVWHQATKLIPLSVGLGVGCCGLFVAVQYACFSVVQRATCSFDDYIYLSITSTNILLFSLLLMLLFVGFSASSFWVTSLRPIWLEAGPLSSHGSPDLRNKRITLNYFAVLHFLVCAYFKTFLSPPSPLC